MEPKQTRVGWENYLCLGGEAFMMWRYILSKGETEEIVEVYVYSTYWILKGDVWLYNYADFYCIMKNNFLFFLIL